MRLILVALAFALGAIASRIAFATIPSRFSIDLAQPVTVVTWWGSTGALMLGILLATVAIACAAYVWVLRRHVSRVRVTVAASALALAAGLAWAPLFSSDIYAYAAYGEMARLGLNPYTHLALPNGNELFRAALWQWTGSLPACVYGAAFVALARGIVQATAAFGAALQIEAFRVVSCAAFALSAFLISRIGAAGDRERGMRAAVFLALNPVALWAAIEGHNDTLMLAVALAGIALYRRNAFAGALLAELAGSIKLPGIATGIVLGIVDALERRFNAIAGGIAGLIIVGVLSLPLIYGAATNLAPHGHYLPLASVQSLHPAVAIVLAAVVLMQLRFAQTPVDRACLVALAAWLAIPNPYPWYALWLLPIGAWVTDRRLAATVLTVTLAAMLRYVPDAIALPNEAGTIALGLAALLAYAPLASRAIIIRP